MAAILYGIVTFLLQQVVIKVVVYGVLFLFISGAISFLTPYIFSGDGGLAGLVASIGGSVTFQNQTIQLTPMINYILNYALVPLWLQSILTA